MVDERNSLLLGLVANGERLLTPALIPKAMEVTSQAMMLHTFSGFLSAVLEVTLTATGMASDQNCRELRGGEILDISMIAESGDETVLHIPSEYIWSIDLVPGDIRSSLLLAFWRENGKPYTLADLNTPQQRAAYATFDRHDLFVLLETRSGLLDEVLERFSNPPFYAAPALGRAQPADFGLSTTTDAPAQPFDRVFWKKSASHISDVMLCDEQAGVVKPSCTHYFVANGLGVQISYLREELHLWNSLRQSVDDMLACFTTAN